MCVCVRVTVCVCVHCLSVCVPARVCVNVSGCANVTDTASDVPNPRRAGTPRIALPIRVSGLSGQRLPIEDTAADTGRASSEQKQTLRWTSHQQTKTSCCDEPTYPQHAVASQIKWEVATLKGLASVLARKTVAPLTDPCGLVVSIA